MSESLLCPDLAARQAAVATFNRNVVVLAGAGTGKTTLLVNRLLHTILREPGSVRLVNVLALTFTNKAADEIKLRLRGRLQALLDECDARVVDLPPSHSCLKEFRDTYHLATETIRVRVSQALEDLEQSHIRTLHSFSASVLRLYPLEAQVDPHAREDDHARFEVIFEEVWERWLDRELGQGGSANPLWKGALQVVSLQELRSLAQLLAREHCPLEDLYEYSGGSSLGQTFNRWVKSKSEDIQGLLTVYGRPKPRKVERQLEAASRVFDHAMTGTFLTGWDSVKEDILVLNGVVAAAPSDWESSDFRMAKQAVQAAQQLLRVNHPLLKTLCQLLQPCIQRIRQRFEEEGWIGFDEVLIKVRNVLRDHSLVREQLKLEYQAILIDEFQDTDPLQYETLLYLAEMPGRSAQSWRDVQVVPGKLFIVGDPKQSIYGFRRADIAAFDQVVNMLIDQGAMVCALTTNFRSSAKVLQVVNEVFDRLLIQKDHVQPPYVRLEVGRTTPPMSESGVELVALAQPEQEREWDAERATRAEAEWLGDWLQRLLQYEGGRNHGRGVSPGMVHPSQVALLFRKFTNTHWYVEALRRRGIPYVMEGERHFYQRQEVIDLVNVLRLVDDPADSIALVGVLRSSLGGLSDQDIMTLAGSGPLNINDSRWLEGWDNPQKPLVQTLSGQLSALNRLKEYLSPAELLEEVFEVLPLLELAAAASHGEQAVCNLRKLRERIGEMGSQTVLSFSGIVDHLVACVRRRPAESEATLAEDSVDAVRVLTIHKAKGLEFPIVVLPGLHVKAGGMDGGASVTRDWLSGLSGCTFSRWCNAGHVPLWEKQREQEEAEQRRLLYVGMTRAKERLILSGGHLGKSIGNTPFQLLREIAGEDFGNPACPAIRVGAVSIAQTVVTHPISRALTPLRNEGTVATPSVPERLSVNWNTRNVRWQQAQATKVWMTPSSSTEEPLRTGLPGSGSMAGRNGRETGILVHRFLEYCDFSQDRHAFQGSLDRFCRMFREALPAEAQGGPVVMEEAYALLKRLPDTSIYEELSRGMIVAREVPVILPWEVEGPDGRLCQGIMEGVVDVVYHMDGECWIGDYKTDRVGEERVTGHVEAYRSQAERYIQAVSRCLGLDIKGCKLFFIRLGYVAVVPRREGGSRMSDQSG